MTEVVRRLDPELPVPEVGTMQRWVDESLSRTKFQPWLLALFGGLALAPAERAMEVDLMVVPRYE